MNCIATSGTIFPVPATILERIESYRAVLEDYSQRLLPLVEWEATDRCNVRVLNDTGDFYRYFDANPHAEFLYGRVRETIEQELPKETVFLKNYDTFRCRIGEMIDMPDRTIDLLFRLLQQNGGKLSHRARAKEFSALTATEAAAIEAIYQNAFG